MEYCLFLWYPARYQKAFGFVDTRIWFDYPQKSKRIGRDAPSICFWCWYIAGKLPNYFWISRGIYWHSVRQFIEKCIYNRKPWSILDKNQEWKEYFWYARSKSTTAICYYLLVWVWVFCACTDQNKDEELSWAWRRHEISSACEQLFSLNFKQASIPISIDGCVFEVNIKSGNYTLFGTRY